MQMFLNDNKKLLESTNTFDRLKIAKQQRFWSTKTLHFNFTQDSTLRFEIKTNKPAFTNVNEM